MNEWTNNQPPLEKWISYKTLVIKIISGTYFNCIMFMVASSVVSTILILNYHHRNADTHVMSAWVCNLLLHTYFWLDFERDLSGFEHKWCGRSLPNEACSISFLFDRTKQTHSNLAASIIHQHLNSIFEQDFFSPFLPHQRYLFDARKKFASKFAAASAAFVVVIKFKVLAAAVANAAFQHFALWFSVYWAFCWPPAFCTPKPISTLLTITDSWLMFLTSWQLHCC